MGATLVIAHRFRGPPTSGNGGWTAGSLADVVGGPAEVTLRRPPPLDRPLDLVRHDDATVRLLEGGEVVAEAVPLPADDRLSWPTPLSLEEARAAEARFAGHAHHPFPSCFTCGTGRLEGDGLRIFTGPVEGRDGVVAATWTPDPSTVGDDGANVAGPVVWAAVDCPTAWPFLGDGTVALLGRMAAVIERPVVVGETYVVVGEATGVEGRKRHAIAGLFTTDGARVAASRSTWLTIDG